MSPWEQLILSNAVVATGLALLVTAVSCVWRRPALVHSLWLLVLLKLITPPILPIEIVQTPAEKPTPPEVPLAAQTLFEGQDNDDEEIKEDSLAWVETVPERDPEPSLQEIEPPAIAIPQPVSEASAIFSWPAWRPILGLIWLAGSLVWLGVAGFRVFRFQQLLAHAKAAPEEMRDQVRQIAECLGLARCPDVWLVPGAISPMIWPVGARSRLLVPAGLLDRLSVEQRATLLVHELAHLRRRDHWVRALELIVTGLYWWHPVVWWARREISEAEEQCCDAWVVWALPEAARSYASALLETVDFLAEARPVWLPPAASGLGHFRILKRRLHMIMLGNTPRALSRAGFLAVLGLGVLLPVLPTWGQQSKDDDKQIDKKEIIRKSVKDAIKQIDIDKIKKIKEELINELDKDLNLDKDMLKKIQIEVFEKLDKELDKIPEDVIKNLDDLIKLKSDQFKVDPDELKRSLAQLIESRVRIDDPAQSKDKGVIDQDLRKAEAELAEAKAQFQRAQEQMKQAQKRLVEMERQVKQMHLARSREETRALRAKKEAEARDREFRRFKEGKDKDWIEKPESSRFEKKKDLRKGEDDLEQRFERLMKEVQDLGRELKRRRNEERRPDREEGEEGAKP